MDRKIEVSTGSSQRLFSAVLYGIPTDKLDRFYGGVTFLPLGKDPQPKPPFWFHELIFNRRGSGFIEEHRYSGNPNARPNQPMPIDEMFKAKEPAKIEVTFPSEPGQGVKSQKDAATISLAIFKAELLSRTSGYQTPKEKEPKAPEVDILGARLNLLALKLSPTPYILELRQAGELAVVHLFPADKRSLQKTPAALNEWLDAVEQGLKKAA